MLELKDIKVSFKAENQKSLFGKERNQIIKGVSLKIKDKQCLGILGESGSGKTTLGRVMIGNLKPEAGSLFIDGHEIKNYKKDRKILQEKISIVFQDYTTSVNPRFTIKSIIKEGISVYERKSSKKLDRKKEVLDLLKKVGLDETFLKRFPHELSGGQLQRVCIARAIACRPELIILDEAISSLDAHTQVQIMDLLLDLKEEMGLTYVFITHDLTSISYICDEVIFFRDGQIREQVEVDNLANVENVYAKKLLNSVIDFTR